MLRFAPSPTGDMDIDTLRVAIVNYLVAQQQNKPFTIRIEDADKTRNIEGKDTEIMQILEKFALKHESLFHQSEHLHMYQTLAIGLLEKGKAFVCTCGDTTDSYNNVCFDLDNQRLNALKQSNTPFVLRIKKPQASIAYDDIIHGNILTKPDEIDSFVILHSDGTPTYNFACACDDMLGNVTTIIRSQKHITNTARQKHIKHALGFEDNATYAHLPTLLDTDAHTMQALFEEGFVPDAIINTLLSLGATPSHEIFTLPDAIEWFDIANVSKEPLAFDRDRLLTINQHHLRKMDDVSLSKLFGFADADIGKLAKFYLKEVCTIEALKSKIEPIFAPKNFECQYAEQMHLLQELIFDAPMIEHFDDFYTYLQQKSKLQPQTLDIALALLLTGECNVTPLKHIYSSIKSYLLEVAS